MFLVNVPHQCTEEDLRAWFRAGIVGGDTEVLSLTRKIRKVEKRVRQLRAAVSDAEAALSQTPSSMGTSSGRDATAAGASASALAGVDAADAAAGGVTGGAPAALVTPKEDKPMTRDELMKRQRYEQLSELLREAEQSVLPALYVRRSELVRS